LEGWKASTWRDLLNGSAMEWLYTVAFYFDVLRVYSFGILYSVAAQSLQCLASASVCLVFIQIIIKVELEIIHFMSNTLITPVTLCAYLVVQNR